MGIVQGSSRSGRRTLRTKLSPIGHRNVLYGGATSAMIDWAAVMSAFINLAVQQLKSAAAG